MKLLLEKEIILPEGNLHFRLMLEGEDLNDNESYYALHVYLPKIHKMKSCDVVKNIKDVLSEYFLSTSEYKKALYVPGSNEVSVYGEGYIDVFYKLDDKHPILDKGYETEDGEIGKNLMSIDADYSNRASDLLKLEFKSLFLVDEKYNIQNLWEFADGKVYDFLVEEISEKINK